MRPLLVRAARIGAALALLATTAQAQAKPVGPPPKPIEWQAATPELPAEREAGVAATGPVEGPTEPGIKEIGSGIRLGQPMILYFAWPDRSAPGAGTGTMTLDIEIWKDPLVIVAAKDFLCLKMDSKACPEPVLKKFGVAAVPTIVFYTCDGVERGRMSGASKDPEAFAQRLTGYAKKNLVILAAREARTAALKGQLAAADKLKDAGKLDTAVKAYEALIKSAPGTPQCEDARFGLREVKMIRVAAEGEALFKQDKFYEARGRLQLVFDFEMPCPARDLARKLLPECEMGIRFLDACRLHTEGKSIEAMEALAKIVTEEEYTGPFKAKAEEKIAAIKAAYGK